MTRKVNTDLLFDKTAFNKKERVPLRFQEPIQKGFYKNKLEYFDTLHIKLVVFIMILLAFPDFVLSLWIMVANVLRIYYGIAPLEILVPDFTPSFNYD